MISFEIPKAVVQFESGRRQDEQQQSNVNNATTEATKETKQRQQKAKDGPNCKKAKRKRKKETTKRKKKKEKKKRFLLDLCVSSLRRGHANLLCFVPNLTDDLFRDSESCSSVCVRFGARQHSRRRRCRAGPERVQSSKGHGHVATTTLNQNKWANGVYFHVERKREVEAWLLFFNI